MASGCWEMRKGDRAGYSGAGILERGILDCCRLARPSTCTEIVDDFEPRTRRGHDDSGVDIVTEKSRKRQQANENESKSSFAMRLG